MLDGGIETLISAVFVHLSTNLEYKNCENMTYAGFVVYWKIIGNVVLNLQRSDLRRYVREGLNEAAAFAS